MKNRATRGLKALMTRRLQDVLLIRVQAKLSRWIGGGKFKPDAASTISTDINHINHINQLISQSCIDITVQMCRLPDHHRHGPVLVVLRMAAIPSL